MSIRSMNIGIALIALITVGIGYRAKSAWAQSVPLAEVEAIAEEAYIYLYPLITMDVSRRQLTNMEPGKMPGRGPMNAFSHMRSFPDANFREVVRPNFDTLYSSGWLDLTKEPVVVTVPDTDGRYYLLPMLDMWSDVFAVPGSRTSGNKAATFLVAPVDWRPDLRQRFVKEFKLPDDTRLIESPTPYVWVIGRTKTDGPKDYEAVHKVQAGYTITPLSQWGKKVQAPEVVIDPGVDMKTSPLAQVNGMQADKYFTYGASLMKINAPHHTDWSTIARLKRIGIEPGKFDASKADPAAVARGAAAGLKLMQDKLPTLARVTNGWQMNTDTMGVYGNYYLKRAIVAMVGLGANQPEDAIYPLAVVDADGKPPVAESKYVLSFTKDTLPPVDAFWSLTMYDGDGFQVANPINRFAIGDRDPLKFDADGSLTLFIQHESPGPDKESNWLPAPKSGPIGLTMRLYAPRAQALDGRWNPPAIKKVD